MSETALPSLDSHDGSLWLDDTKGKSLLETIPDSVVDVNLPLVGRDASGLGVVDGVNTSREVELSGGLLISGDWDQHIVATIRPSTYHR